MKYAETCQTMKTSKPFALLIVALVFATSIASAAQTIAVYKNEGCGCCELWIKHLGWKTTDPNLTTCC